MDDEDQANHPQVGQGDERMPGEDEMSLPGYDEVEKWSVELREIETRLAELNERKAMLQQVLETMPVIEKLRGNAPSVTERSASTHQSPDIADGPTKLVHAIPLVLQRYRKPMTPAQIKDHLRDVGFVKDFGETYFYTAIKRAVEKKTVTKKRDGRYVYRDANGLDYPT